MISCQAERNSSALGATLDSLWSTVAADKVDQLMLLRPNESLIPEIRAQEKELANMKV